MNLDINVYPDSYPVFSKPRQFLIRNHFANIDSTHQKPARISPSPGFKRQCELNKDPHQSPLALPEIINQKPSSALGNYQISYYPTSPLNPELEEQCMMLELFRNINKLDFRKTREKSPSKIVRKGRKVKFEANIRNYHNLSAFACREVECPNCKNLKCVCPVNDHIAEDVGRRIMSHTLNAPERKKKAERWYGEMKKNNVKNNTGYMKNRVKRRPKAPSVNVEDLKSLLSIF